jgi:hypothetical protein
MAKGVFRSSYKGKFEANKKAPAGFFLLATRQIEFKTLQLNLHMRARGISYALFTLLDAPKIVSIIMMARCTWIVILFNPHFKFRNYLIYKSHQAENFNCINVLG